MPTADDLFDPGAHEPLAGAPWDAGRARSAVRAIMEDAERAFDPDTLWPAHPLDEEPDEPPLDAPVCVYLGAAGVIWALDALARAGAAEPERDWAGIAATVPGRHRVKPDFPEPGLEASLALGETGVLLVAHRLAPSTHDEERLLDLVRRNVTSPFLEPMVGAPGTMLAAAVMHERTGAAVWVEAWEESADAVLDAWQDEVWLQELFGRPGHVLGAAHGFVGNIHALTYGGLLDEARRSEVERRAVDVVRRHVRRREGLAQWPESLAWPYPGRPVEVRTQWCHGAPGLVTALADVAVGNDELTQILVEAGELTWRAGPHAKGPGICHGTAGNGYAFLKLLRRTGDELWLERARAFAMHAIGQSERARRAHGMGRYSLWTGDPGLAVYLHGCVVGDPALPTLDAF